MKFETLCWLLMLAKLLIAQMCTKVPNQCNQYAQQAVPDLRCDCCCSEPMGPHRSMTNQAVQEYDDDLMKVLETVWGEGFMSPGGTDEVDSYLQGVDLKGRSVLDIGCGLGGVDIHLVRQHGAALVTGLDIDAALIERCKQLAKKYDVSAQTRFVCVEPGPLPFSAASFEVVTSKDSIIHIADKHALAVDVCRVLQPGGCFVASDWLAGYQQAPSVEMQAYLDAEGLDFGLASAETYCDALEKAGFTNIEIVDRNEWYRQIARQERARMGGSLYADLSARVGPEFLDHEIGVWDKMIVALDQGQLRPTHISCSKPV